LLACAMRRGVYKRRSPEKTDLYQITYRYLDEYEKVYTERSLKKTQIKMTPMYHWAPRRIEAHIRICVLALLIQRVAEMECRDSWFNIRKELGKLQATECRTKNHVFFKRNEVFERTKDIFKSLKTPLPKSLLRVSDVGTKA